MEAHLDPGVANAAVLGLGVLRWNQRRLPSSCDESVDANQRPLKHIESADEGANEVASQDYEEDFLSAEDVKNNILPQKAPPFKIPLPVRTALQPPVDEVLLFSGNLSRSWSSQRSRAWSKGVAVETMQASVIEDVASYDDKTSRSVDTNQSPLDYIASAEEVMNDEPTGSSAPPSVHEMSSFDGNMSRPRSRQRSRACRSCSMDASESLLNHAPSGEEVAQNMASQELREYFARVHEDKNSVQLENASSNEVPQLIFRDVVSLERDGGTDSAEDIEYDGHEDIESLSREEVFVTQADADSEETLEAESDSASLETSIQVGKAGDDAEQLDVVEMATCNDNAANQSDMEPEEPTIEDTATRVADMVGAWNAYTEVHAENLDAMFIDSLKAAEADLLDVNIDRDIVMVQ
ncbi:hypothetical protein HDU81_010376, partial [Chytriomyces hyalinus]